MRELHFAKKINDNGSGLIDVSKNPPEVFCYCEEAQANEILKLYKASVHESVYEPPVYRFGGFCPTCLKLKSKCVCA